MDLLTTTNKESKPVATPVNLDRFQYRAEPLVKAVKSAEDGIKRQTQEEFMAGTKALRERALNNASSSSMNGLYTSNSAEMKDKQNNSAKILEEIKKYLDKKDLPRLLEVFKEVKTCPTIDPVFKKLKSIFFGQVLAPSRATDRQFSEKIQCLVDLGFLIPKKLREEYMRLVGEIQSNSHALD